MLGKVVLITGASSGIGAGSAVYFASRGSLLSLTGRSVVGLQNTRQACIEAGSKEDDILLISADLEVEENVKSIVKQTVEKFGKLDVLVNNAACFKETNLENTAVEDFNMIMNTNVKSVFFLTQLAMPHLIKSKGNVVNISSISAQRPYKNEIVYCMSKAALDHFTRIVALDVAAKNVRVNAINPGAIRTPIFERSGSTFDLDKMEKIYHAMKRAGTVEEIAKVIGFLADDEQSSFMTGETILVDGGAFLLGPI